jgi:hypothetical protein
MSEPSLVITLDEADRLLGHEQPLSKYQRTRLARKGAYPPAFKCAGQRVVLRRDLEELVERLREGAPEEAARHRAWSAKLAERRLAKAAKRAAGAP